MTATILYNALISEGPDFSADTKPGFDGLSVDQAFDLIHADNLKYSS